MRYFGCSRLRALNEKENIYSLRLTKSNTLRRDVKNRVIILKAFCYYSLTVFRKAPYDGAFYFSLW